MTRFDELTLKFREFQAIPFPENSDNDELSEIYAELVEYDGHIAGIVSSYLAGRKVKEEWIQGDLDLSRRIYSFQPSTHKEMEIQATYEDYKARLDELILMVQALIHIDTDQ